MTLRQRGDRKRPMTPDELVFIGRQHRSAAALSSQDLTLAFRDKKIANRCRDMLSVKEFHDVPQAPEPTGDNPTGAVILTTSGYMFQVVSLQGCGPLGPQG